MSKAKLEYIWLDGYQPTQSLRSKTKVVSDFSGKLEDCPQWCFDGSSTQQAEGGSSDCLLEPCAIIPDPDPGGYPRPQGPFYCSVGAANAYGRHVIEDHLDQCLEAGLNVEGINAEVAAGQWEFQVFAKGAKAAGDETWLARYLLERTGEKYGYAINYHPKPFGTMDWNGSGMHANFSNTTLREAGNEETYNKICEAFRPRVKEHIAVYGADNDQRLTGDHETQSIDEFSFGVSDRGASIRIPVATVTNGWKGWLEDRRPASNADPYKVAAEIIKTVKGA